MLPPSWPLNSYTSIDRSAEPSALYAAKTVDGSTISSIRATDRYAGAVMRRASTAPSK